MSGPGPQKDFVESLIEFHSPAFATAMNAHLRVAISYYENRHSHIQMQQYVNLPLDINAARVGVLLGGHRGPH